ncbi:MAG: 2'-deoxycytidine 5'-triphosphate deaminase [Alteromonadaceae bacterium]|nr:2'-deoxycytidine 5'-triphosphate deaminase [Alteromonadaceae bacterium]
MSYRNGILPYQDIVRLVEAGDVIQGGHVKNVKSASYDLRLGETYYLFDSETNDTPNLKDQARIKDNQIRVSKVTKDEQSGIMIPEHQAIYVTCKEKINLPNNTIGHVSLKFGLTMKGILMSAQSQFDAGYSGGVFALLFNLTNKEIFIPLDSPVLRLELVKIKDYTEKSYSGEVAQKELKDMLHERMTSSNFDISNKFKTVSEELKNKFEEETRAIKKRFTLTSSIGILVTIGIFIGTIFVTYYSKISTLEQKVAHLEARIESVEK